jgi:hypothetical protein
MLEDSVIIEVVNRSDCNSGYILEDGNVHRSFTPGEMKKITMGELRALSYSPGGDALLREFLQIKNAEAIEELLGEVEPEYNYTPEDVKRVMVYGTMDEFLDMLDFAPDGVREMIKDFAVKLELNDVAKREAIFTKYGFNVDNAIKNNRLEKEALAKEETQTKQEQSGRRVPVGGKPQVNMVAGRRTAPPVADNKYKVVSK